MSDSNCAHVARELIAARQSVWGMIMDAIGINYLQNGSRHSQHTHTHYRDITPLPPPPPPPKTLRQVSTCQKNARADQTVKQMGLHKDLLQHRKQQTCEHPANDMSLFSTHS